MKNFQISLVSLLTTVAAAFHLQPVVQRSANTFKLQQASLPMDDRTNAGKIMYRKLDFPMKETDLERAKVRLSK